MSQPIAGFDTYSELGGEPRIFACSEERCDVYDASRVIVEYADAEDIALIAFVERAARPIKTGFDEYWRLTHEADAVEPKLCFIDPKQVCVNGIVDRCLSQTDVQTDPAADFTEYKDAPVMVVDTCVHTGRSMRPILRFMKRNGFTDVRLGVVNGEPNWSGVTPDVVMLDRIPARGCYPFGKDFVTPAPGIVPAGSDKKEPADIGRSALLYGEIKQIIRERLRRIVPQPADDRTIVTV